MSFWSTLAGIGGTLAAPFTGGLSALAGPAVSALTGEGSKQPAGAGNLAQTAGSIEAARAKALVDQAQLGQGQDRNAQTRYLNQLAGMKQNAAMPQQLASNSARGDVLANAQDANISGLPSYIHMGTVTGGLRPGLLSKNSRALGAQMSRDALTHSMTGDLNAGAPPELTPLPTASGMDKGLQGVALGGSFLNALGQIGKGGGGKDDPNSGQVAGDVTDGLPIDPEDPNQAMADPFGALPQNTGIDPEIAKYWQQQGQPDPTEGVG